MSFHIFRLSDHGSTYRRIFQKNHEIDFGFFRRRFYRIIATCGFDGLGDHALYLPSSTRLCGWNWGQIGGVLGFMTNFYELLTGGSYESVHSSFVCSYWAWLLRFTTILWGWQFGSYPNSLDQNGQLMKRRTKRQTTTNGTSR